jgi:hypothetical protein
MKKKKLQVFISSTYTDLKMERQAAVEAVLEAGHIPAGMELFSAGNKTQLEIIKKWIDESDVYLLILGGRYGSIEPESHKSYTHLEYEYALGKGMPIFAVFITDEALERKNKKLRNNAIEKENIDQYLIFKKMVLSKISKPFEDTKDVKYAILQTLSEIQKEYDLDGWISGKTLKHQMKQERLLKKLNDNLPKIAFVQNVLGAPVNPTYEINPSKFEYIELEVLLNKQVGKMKFGPHPHGFYEFKVFTNGYGHHLRPEIPKEIIQENSLLKEGYSIQVTTYDFSASGIEHIIIAIGNGFEGHFWIYSYTEVADASKFNPFTLELTRYFQSKVRIQDNEVIIPIGSQGLFDAFYWFQNSFFQKANRLGRA